MTKKTPKDPGSSDSSLPDIPSPEECSRPLHQFPGRRPNQTAHLRDTQHQRAHFATHLGNMSPPPLKLLQQQNNVLHQQAKAKFQGTHNILTTNSISILHKIEMV